MSAGWGTPWPTGVESQYNPAAWVSPAPSERGNDWYNSGDHWLEPSSNVANKNGDGWDPTPPDPRQLNDLVDWTGGFGPPPVQWDDRPVYWDPDLGRRIEDWRERVSADVSGSGAGFFQTPQKALLDIQDGHKYEICPFEWNREAVGEQPMGPWWVQHLQGLRETEPDCFSNHGNQIDPFWDRYMRPEKERLLPIQVANAKVDPNDTHSRKNHAQTAMRSAGEAMLRAQRRKENVRGFKQERQRMRRHQRSGAGFVTEQSPKVNMYIRPAERRDLPQLFEITNHNVENAVDLPEMERLSERIVESRRLDIVQASLPFLVAVHRSSKGQRRQGLGNSNQEHILGMAFADDYQDRDGMFRYTVEAECYVRPEYMRKGVGTALMDKMLCYLDPTHAAFGGYDFVGEELGKRRVVKNIMVHLHVSEDDGAKLAWCEEWLQKLGFTRKGEFKGAGRKLNQIVDMYLFWKVTGSQVPANAP